MTEDKKPTVEELKELGNKAVNNSSFTEGILHYTHAIKMDPTNYFLFSNRSLAFLKMEQYLLAMDDALECIRLNSSWPKGYFRKGEIEFATYQYEKAMNSYEIALKFAPGDSLIIKALEKTHRANLKDLKDDEQIPWLGSGIGIVVGVIIVFADYIFTNTPTHPLIMAFVTIAIALAGYGIAKLCRYYIKSQRNALFDVPDLLEEEEENTKSESKTSPRYTKSQARQRYKKGKM